MADINTAEDICNMALGFLGNYETIASIETPTPTNDKEIVFSLWYDITRQALLKEVKPNFACRRKFVAQLDSGILEEFGYEHNYEYPADCLRVLGIADIEERFADYGVEDGKIWTDEDYADGLPLRYVADAKIVSKFSPEFKVLLAMNLGINCAMQLTQSMDKVQLLQAAFQQQKLSVAAQNSQENKPIRVERSRFLESREYDVSNRQYKR